MGSHRKPYDQSPKPEPLYRHFPHNFRNSAIKSVLLTIDDIVSCNIIQKWTRNLNIKPQYSIYLSKMKRSNKSQCRRSGRMEEWETGNTAIVIY